MRVGAPPFRLEPGSDLAPRRATVSGALRRQSRVRTAFSSSDVTLTNVGAAKRDRGHNYGGTMALTADVRGKHRTLAAVRRSPHNGAVKLTRTGR